MIAMYSTEDQLISFKFSLRHKGTIVSHIWISKQGRKTQFVYLYLSVSMHVCKYIQNLLKDAWTNFLKFFRGGHMTTGPSYGEYD